MNDPPLAKGDIGGFSKHLNPPLLPFSKGGGCKQIYAPGNMFSFPKGYGFLTG
jgi:hypothetical protein